MTQKRSNPIVFMDVRIGDFIAGRVTFELFADTHPFTAENFRCLCTGEKGLGLEGKQLHFKGSRFFRILEGFIIQGGDIINNDGTGGESIYGGNFSDESFIHRHQREGLLAMANEGRHQNNSQFYITLRAQPHLDSDHVVFGQVIEGYHVVIQISKSGTAIGLPRYPIEIYDCGEITIK